ncbi:hypothetical protein LFL96_21200 [Paraburkholderia sp. D15]|uniref:hypothetical protein n=1 Tax=Paraburkholderia sp. D15 TaxID=2880218 RepID=UPI00247838F5|nr:hypothetical protein [Paraburkholderia sp. D15]WGS53577.1 hypothetical protein LFL96_21200 [Paraburkholderia sp. D15]
MADLSDVQNTLGALAGAALYPSGPSSPSAVNIGVVIRSGWPVPEQLKAILADGNAMISVYQMSGMGQNTTRFLGDDDAQTAVPVADLTLGIYGYRVTVGGRINPGEAATLTVNYQPYSYQVAENDTVNTIAAALAALIPGASASGYVITINGAFDIKCAVSVPVVTQQEIGRQTQVFMLVIWAPSPAARDAICKTLELAFKLQPRIPMPDNTWARLIYRGTIEQDGNEKQGIYRRNLLYEVEYVLLSPTTSNTVTNFGVTTTPTSGSPRTTNI